MLAGEPTKTFPGHELERLVEAIVALLTIEDLFVITRRAVELARDTIGLVRVSIYLVDQFKGLLSGTWASDSSGAIMDEHNVMYALGNTDRKALSYDGTGAPYTVFKNCLIVEDRPDRTEVAAHGWVTCTPVRCGEDIVGLVFNDAGPSRAAFDETKQAKLAMLCFVLGAVIRSSIAARGSAATGIDQLPMHRLVMKAVGVLTRDATPGVAAIARALGITSSHLKRVFERHVGVSPWEYRDRIRLHRVAVLAGTGRANVVDAVIAAGFESSARFHRAQRTLRWMRWLKRLAN